MSQYEYNYQLYIGENKSGNLDTVELAKDAKILHLRNAVFDLNKASLPNTSRNTLEVYPPGTKPPFPPDGLNPGIMIQKFIGDDENKDIANELEKGTWIVVAKPQLQQPRANLQDQSAPMAEEEQGADEIKIPADIERAITGYTGRRKPFTSNRLHSNITTLFSHGDEPDFLTYKLGEEYYSDQTTRNRIQDLMKEAPVWVVGVSGAGKTRTVLEILSSQCGIYFSASPFRLVNPADPQTQKPCAKDLAWISDDSVKDPGEETLALTLWRLDCAVAARFLVLQRKLDIVAKNGGHFTPLDWVLMQLYPPTVPSPGTNGREVDIFEALTAVIFASYQNKYKSAVEKMLKLQLHTLIKCIVVDEAQVAMQQNKNRYPNTKNTKKHPLLSPVIRALWEIGSVPGMCPILCGTGISMMKLSSIAVSAVATVQVKKRDPGDKYKMQVPISTVLDPQPIRTLLKQVLVSGVYEGHQLCQWSRVLMGRPRILWGFLSLALARSDGIDEVFKEYCEDLTSREEGESSKTTLYSCVTRALTRKAVGETTSSPSVGDAFLVMVVNWITGQTPPDLEEEDKVDIIVDCGVCILERKGTKLVAKLREPLVVQAYLVFVRKTSDTILKKIMSMLKAATEPSSQGFLFELLFYFAFQGFLNGKSLQEAGFVPSATSDASAPTPPLPGFFDEACDIPFESIGNCLLRLPDSPGGGPFQLQSHFLDAHRDYLLSDKKRPRPRSAATPAKKDKDDLVVVAYTKNHVLIFLIQCKLEQNTDYLKAVQTTFPDLLLHQAKKMKIETPLDQSCLNELGRKVADEYQLPEGQIEEYLALQGLLNESTWGTRAVHVVQLVVAYPAVVGKLGETRWIQTKHCKNQLQLGMMLNREPQQNENKRLLVVVRGKKLKELLGDDVFGRLEEVKAKPGSEVDCSPEPVNLGDLSPYSDDMVGDEKESD